MGHKAVLEASTEPAVGETEGEVWTGDWGTGRLGEKMKAPGIPISSPVSPSPSLPVSISPSSNSSARSNPAGNAAEDPPSC